MKLPVEAVAQFTTGSFGEHVGTHDSVRVTVAVQHVDGSPPVLLSAWTASRLCLTMNQECLTDLPPSVPHLGPWADAFDGGQRHISLMIGADNIWRVCTGQIFKFPGEPAALGTIFGWLLSGSWDNVTKSCNNLAPSPSSALFVSDLEVHRFWDLESLGIRDSPDVTDYPKPVFIAGEGRYEVRLPFLDHRRPASNHASCEAQLSRITSKMPSEQLEKYQDGMQSLAEKSIVELAPSPAYEGFYLPHHGVWRKEKLRIVFNGSAITENKLSLNACLDPGPNLLALLLDLLIRFRLYPHVVLGDIEAAFHQVLLHPDDRRWVKFLWNSEAYQFCRVPFGLSASPFLLHSTIIYHIDVSDIDDPEFKQLLRNVMYCDNLVNSFDDRQKAAEFLTASIDCFASAGMKLKVPDPSKVLGVPWNVEGDYLSVDTTVIELPARFTRRQLLRSVSMIYDPLGLVCAWTIRARVLMQELVKIGLGWDDEVVGEHLQQWIQWANESRSEVHVPRCVQLQPATRIHVFCDASATAYATIVFAVTPSQESTLLFCKARVAPVKPPLSVPRLELMAALIGCRFAYRLREIVDISRVHFWLDSTSVLSWVRKGPSKKDIFVSNRIKEICDKSSPDEWRYVPTHLNAADIPSRGARLADLSTNSLYLHGPAFLSYPPSEWPASPPLAPQLIIIEAPQPVEMMNHLVPLLKYSSLDLFLRVHAWIRRFCRNAQGIDPILGPLTSTEVNQCLERAILIELKYHYPWNWNPLPDLRQLLAHLPCRVYDLSCPRMGSSVPLHELVDCRCLSCLVTVD